MRVRGARAVIVVLAVVAATVVAAPGLAPPAAATGVSVASAALGAPRVTARGLVPADIPVTVHLVGGVAGTTYAAVLEDVGGSGRALAVTLDLTSGAAGDGQWAGRFRVAADEAGRFALVTVTAMAGDSVDYLPVPEPRPEVVVVGSHVPRLTVTQRPDPVRVEAPVTIVGRLVDTATGRGFPGVPVRHMVSCDPGLCPATSVRTDARGWFTVPFRLVRVRGVLVPPQRMMHSFAVRAGTQSDGAWVYAVMTTSLVRVGVSVTAAPARPVVRAGSPVTVAGRVVGSAFGAIRGVDFPSPRCRLVLERLRGASSWRAVASAVMRSTHRYTLVDPSAARGRHAYRVRALTCGPQQRAVSPRFVVAAA